MDNIEEVAKRIQALEDLEAIKRLKAEYASACDDKYNPERMRMLLVVVFSKLVSKTR